ncbi:uncharacterized [Tachysurus ichikawai]
MKMSFLLLMSLEEIPESLIFTIPFMSQISVCGHRCHVAGSEAPCHTWIMHSSRVTGTTLRNHCKKKKKSNGRHSPTELPCFVYLNRGFLLTQAEQGVALGFMWPDWLHRAGKVTVRAWFWNDEYAKTLHLQ